jgi:hypothetical protein
MGGKGTYSIDPARIVGGMGAVVDGGGAELRLRRRGHGCKECHEAGSV